MYTTNATPAPSIVLTYDGLLTLKYAVCSAKTPSIINSAEIQTNKIFL